MRPEDIRAPARDDRQGRVLVDRLLGVAPRQVERPAVHDVGEQAGLAEDARLDRLEQIAVAGGRQRLSVRGAPHQFVVRVPDEHGARLAGAIDEPRQVGDELTLRPDIHERVDAHREAEGAARKRHRRVAVAADRLAAWRGEPASQPHFREIEVGEHRRLRARGRGARASGDRSRRRCRRRDRRRRAPCRRSRGPPRRPRRRSDPKTDTESTRLRNCGPSASTRSRYVAVSARAAASNISACRVVFEAEHDPAREIGTPRLHLIACGRRRRQQMQDRYAGDDREDAAMAAEDPVLDLVAADLIEERGDEREPAAAVRAAQEVECLDVHGGLSDEKHASVTTAFLSVSSPRSSAMTAVCSHALSAGSPIRSSSDSPELIGSRRKCSIASQRLASAGSRRANGLPGPICVRWQRSAASFRGTQSVTFTVRLCGSVAIPKASGVMPNNVEPGGTQPLATAVSVTSRMTPCGMVT